VAALDGSRLGSRARRSTARGSRNGPDPPSPRRRSDRRRRTNRHRAFARFTLAFRGRRPVAYGPAGARGFSVPRDRPRRRGGAFRKRPAALPFRSRDAGRGAACGPPARAARSRPGGLRPGPGFRVAVPRYAHASRRGGVRPRGPRGHDLAPREFRERLRRVEPDADGNSAGRNTRRA